MLFTEPGFLFAFLPLLCLIYWVLPLRLKNYCLLFSSVFFYWWGERLFVLLLVSMLMNWGFGLLVDRNMSFDSAALRSLGQQSKNPLILVASRVLIALLALLRLIGKAIPGSTPHRKWAWVAVFANLSLLGIYKYGDFVMGIISDVGWWWDMEPIKGPYDKPIHLPIGISFFTFQGLSYVLDVHWGLTKRERNPATVGLYVALFPQLIAGPIVRYREIANQINQRDSRLEDIVLGSQRFIIGLAKKMLIANSLGRGADIIFDTPPDQLGMGLAWLGIITYALQLYFDFSGYSDMAIGMGRILGFKFPENFKHPYISRSITEMWQRWHMTLGNWLRDYLFFPLAGKRPSPAKVRQTLFIVFLACGLWHGASYNYLLWGAWNGLFLMVERSPFGKWMDSKPAWLSWAYCMLAWLLGLVLFRCYDLDHSWGYLLAMLGLGGEAPQVPMSAVFAPDFIPAFIAGLIGSAPLVAWLMERYGHGGTHSSTILRWLGNAALYLLFLASIALAVGRGFNPFLYFQF